VTDRPLAKFEDGQLWLDQGGVYEPRSRFNVLMMWAIMKARPGPDAARYAEACNDALNQYNAAMEEAR
jgi:hypothetical protein